jgi:toxin ParE1/3/4
MEKLIFHPAAQAEMLDATVYYEGCRTNLGKEFLDAIDRALTFIAVHPRAGRIIRFSYRQVLVKCFPYAIIYRESGDALYVLAVMHLKRKPGYWESRDIN